jgi:hypothetical protein
MTSHTAIQFPDSSPVSTLLDITLGERKVGLFRRTEFSVTLHMQHYNGEPRQDPDSYCRSDNLGRGKSYEDATDTALKTMMRLSPNSRIEFEAVSDGLKATIRPAGQSDVWIGTDSGAPRGDSPYWKLRQRGEAAVKAYNGELRRRLSCNQEIASLGYIDEPLF